jgi:hypothetical protein
MKIFKQILSFLLVMLSIEFTSAQSFAAFTDISLSHSNSQSSKWEVTENGGGSLNNSAVATLRKQGSAANQSLNFDERYNSFGSAIIRFKTCQAVGKTFTIRWKTYNWVTAKVGEGTFSVTVLPPPQGQITPNFVFSSINSSCNQVTLCVTNTLPGATYVWNNGTNNNFLTSGSCGVFNAPPPALVQVVASCGTGPNSGASTTQTPPVNFTPGVSIDQGSFITICQQEQVTLNATSNTCVNSSSNWAWSSSGGNVSNQFVSSGSTASATFNAQPGFYVVTIQTTDFLGNVRSANINIQVLPSSDPQCNIFFLKKAADKPMATANDEKKMEGIDSNKEKSNENAKMDINNKPTIKQGIYPNPANEVLNVGGIQGVQTIEIVDLNGKVIKTVSVGENEISRALNVSDLSGGIYILKKVKRDGQLEATKFQVIH